MKEKNEQQPLRSGDLLGQRVKLSEFALEKDPRLRNTGTVSKDEGDFLTVQMDGYKMPKRFPVEYLELA